MIGGVGGVDVCGNGCDKVERGGITVWSDDQLGDLRRDE